MIIRSVKTGPWICNMKESGGWLWFLAGLYCQLPTARQKICQNFFCQFFFLPQELEKSRPEGGNFSILDKCLCLAFFTTVPKNYPKTVIPTFWRFYIGQMFGIKRVDFIGVLGMCTNSSSSKSGRCCVSPRVITLLSRAENTLELCSSGPSGPSIL